MIDEKDWAILEIMQQDGRATYGDIGRLVGMAASSVHERVRKMESRGVITGYGPRLDATKLGLGVLAFVNVITNGSCRNLADKIADWPEIEEFHSIAGDDCAMLKIRTPDTDTLEDFLERLRALGDVERTRSTIVLKSRWERSVISRPRVDGMRLVDAI